jgi:hypothetical protein
MRAEIDKAPAEAARSGLQFQDRIPAATEYVVPEFERRAYLNVGIELKRPWRKGDLFFFRKVVPSKPWPVEYDSHTPSSWWQTSIGHARVFVRRTSDHDDRAPAILPVSGNSGFVCSSTSSRSRAVQQASVVTTHNEIGIVQNWREVRERLILAKTCPEGVLMQRGFRRGRDSVIEIVANLIENSLLRNSR